MEATWSPTRICSGNWASQKCFLPLKWVHARPLLKSSSWSLTRDLKGWGWCFILQGSEMCLERGAHQYSPFRTISYFLYLWRTPGSWDGQNGLVTPHWQTFWIWVMYNFEGVKTLKMRETQTSEDSPLVKGQKWGVDQLVEDMEMRWFIYQLPSDASSSVQQMMDIHREEIHWVGYTDCIAPCILWFIWWWDSLAFFYPILGVLCLRRSKR